MISRLTVIFAIVLVGVAIWMLIIGVGTHVVPKVKSGAVISKHPSLGKNSWPKVQTAKPKKAAAETTEPATSGQIAEDHRKIVEALRLFPGNTDTNITNTAQALIDLLPELMKDGQLECAEHISNLLSDKEYKRVLPIWGNPTLDPDVIKVLSTDLMSRPKQVMMPAMLDAIKRPDHPYHEEAKSTMQVLLDQDYGDDVPEWESAMKEFLKKEAVEENETTQQ